ncbi:MAG: tRNA (adenosine(37)-N6)-threonylcarbamoyltransferase complex ATPase subunit type 1 TsaE [Sphingobacteriales bacterium]|nr:MAG: tRNA (adenosine(37)-N6)-threonylcarbamoyltransferase complex ATPase subunit type 1 TsaE [Sphingobacteriales bacterium]
MQISYSLGNIESAAHQFWQSAHRYNILAFSGEMGAGKTTFIHALCNVLGVQDAVSSPTFALVNEYHFDEAGTDRTIYHMDWYRLKDTQDAIDAGMEDNMLQNDKYSFVEWPEKAPELLPRPHLWIAIEATAPEEREMTVSIME